VSGKGALPRRSSPPSLARSSGAGNVRSTSHVQERRSAQKAVGTLSFRHAWTGSFVREKGVLPEDEHTHSLASLDDSPNLSTWLVPDYRWPDVEHPGELRSPGAQGRKGHVILAYDLINLEDPPIDGDRRTMALKEPSELRLHDYRTFRHCGVVESSEDIPSDSRMTGVTRLLRSMSTAVDSAGTVQSRRGPVMSSTMIW